MTGSARTWEKDAVVDGGTKFSNFSRPMGELAKWVTPPAVRGPPEKTRARPVGAYPTGPYTIPQDSVRRPPRTAQGTALSGLQFPLWPKPPESVTPLRGRYLGVPAGPAPTRGIHPSGWSWQALVTETLPSWGYSFQKTNRNSLVLAIELQGVFQLKKHQILRLRTKSVKE